MSNDIEGLREVNMALDALMAALSPAGRRKLGLKIGQQIRRENTRRIAANVAPSGEPFAPRKPQKKEKKLRGKMFKKLRGTAHMQLIRSDSDVRLEFKSRVAKVAAVHHFGLRDKTGPKGRVVQYPARPLLGFSKEDLEAINDLIYEHVAAAL